MTSDSRETQPLLPELGHEPAGHGSITSADSDDAAAHDNVTPEPFHRRALTFLASVASVVLSPPVIVFLVNHLLVGVAEAIIDTALTSLYRDAAQWRQEQDAERCRNGGPCVEHKDVSSEVTDIITGTMVSFSVAGKLSTPLPARLRITNANSLLQEQLHSLPGHPSGDI